MVNSLRAAAARCLSVSRRRELAKQGRHFRSAKLMRQRHELGSTEQERSLLTRYRSRQSRRIVRRWRSGGRSSAGRGRDQVTAVITAMGIVVVSPIAKN